MYIKKCCDTCILKCDSIGRLAYYCDVIKDEIKFHEAEKRVCDKWVDKKSQVNFREV